MKHLFIAWVAFQRRTVSMQPHFGYELKFLSFSFRTRLLRPFEYLFKSIQTLKLFLQRKPDVIWVQLPPTPILHLAFLYKVLFNAQVQIVADCHNATFRKPWIHIPGTIKLLQQCDLVLVHNEWVEKSVISNGWSSDRVSVLEDPPASIPMNNQVSPADFPHPWIIFPCSFNQDEPIENVLEAARLAPELTYILTGKTTRAKGIHNLNNAPDNVKMVGFLSEERFNSFLCHSEVVMGLTKLEGVQLSVANEAVGICKPMVLSDTKTLREIFSKGAIYVDSLKPISIAQGCREAVLRKAEMIQEVTNLRMSREKDWLNRASQIENILTTHRSTGSSD